MYISHHGGHRGVTGSCHQLHLTPQRSLLIDCGMFQGTDVRGRSSPDIDFPLDGISALIVTHVHNDHIGRIPYLLKAGFKGPIYCTRPTAKLIPVMLADSIRLSITRNDRAISDFLRVLQSMIKPLRYNQWEKLDGGASIRLQPAGHVLGSAIAEIEFKEERFVFSGDIGAKHSPLLNDPYIPERADVLVLESTYGDRNHESRENRIERLEQILCKTMNNRGVTIIPAFSLGRTQDLLYELNAIYENVGYQRKCSMLEEIDVFVDSPLAVKLTHIYNELKEYWSDEARETLEVDDEPLLFDNLIKIQEASVHQANLEKLIRTRKPAIVIAGGGMCSGGRVVNYLKAFLDKSNTDVLFVGYQAFGSPGRAIQQAEPGESVVIDKTSVAVNATIHTMTGYSAHADQNDLIAFVQGIGNKPREIRLVHGEQMAQAALNEKLTSLGYNVT